MYESYIQHYQTLAIEHPTIPTYQKLAVHFQKAEAKLQKLQAKQRDREARLKRITLRVLNR